MEPTRPSVPEAEVATRQNPVAAANAGHSGGQRRPANTVKEAPIRPTPSNPLRSTGQQTSDPPPTIKPMRSETAPVSRLPAEEPQVMSRRSETAPVGHTAAPNASASTEVALPSADQLARLNSRKGRPRGLSDPRRVSVGSSPQLRPSEGSHNRDPSGGSISNTPPRLSLGPGWNGPSRLTPEQAFRTSQISYAGSPQRSPNYPPSSRPFSSSPSRRMSNGNSHNRNGSNGSNGSRSPNLRPPMQRLETIHSQSSAGEPSPYFAHKAMLLGRQPSRAERSAAKNIKDAKKKGWRSSMQRGDKKLKKDKIGDGASSAGWTDVSRESAWGHRPSDRHNGDEKGSKCAIM
jgi:hypothetical protein